jgi:hypothetical protein
MTAAFCLALAVALLSAAGASAVTLGQAFTPTANCVTDTTFGQSASASGASFTVPSAGQITSFATRAFDTSVTRSTFRFVVLRPSGLNATVVGLGTGSFVLPAAAPMTPAGSAITAISVQAGDYLGFSLAGGSGNVKCGQNSVAGNDILYDHTAALMTGQTLTMTPRAAARISVSAFIRQYTTLTAVDTTSPGYVLRATLRAGSAPVSGRTVRFTSGAITLCSDVTNSSGVATCSPNLQNKPALGAINQSGYTASFAGNSNFFGSSDHASFASPKKG